LIAVVVVIIVVVLRHVCNIRQRQKENEVIKR